MQLTAVKDALYSTPLSPETLATEDRNVDNTRVEENLSNVEDYMLSAIRVALSHGCVCRRAAGYYGIGPSHRSSPLLPVATIPHPQPSRPSAPAMYLVFL